ncbi:hypothetical protein V6N11_062718 [Hibiscus sabdariffa]|uniref:Uncharacterized protein n=1 Tax=Hibiscus sabdariffa TaxID=183260 RepID=A0ABR2PTD6_9ROSI
MENGSFSATSYLVNTIEFSLGSKEDDELEYLSSYRSLNMQHFLENRHQWFKQNKALSVSFGLLAAF